MLSLDCFFVSIFLKMHKLEGKVIFIIFIHNLKEMLDTQPHATAEIQGGTISGIANFYQTNIGVLVFVEVKGLPQKQGECSGNIFGMHIHEGKSCTGDKTDPFKNAMMHYNPQQCSHPYHAGDLPPLFESNGYALSVFLTNRFTVREIIGRTLIIHENVDDFTTQPSGNSGTKIACGVIQK